MQTARLGVVRVSVEGAVFVIGAVLMLAEVLHRVVAGGPPSAWATGPATVLILGGLFAWRVPNLRKGDDGG